MFWISISETRKVLVAQARGHCTNVIHHSAAKANRPTVGAIHKKDPFERVFCTASLSTPG